MPNSLLQFDELESFGVGNVSPRTMKALQSCDVLDKVGVHVVSGPYLFFQYGARRRGMRFSTSVLICAAACYSG